MDYNSHLLLSAYLSEGRLCGLDRRFFIIGNILPDMLLGTFFKKHSFNSRKEEILQILTKLKSKRRTPFFYLKLGYCMHFIADFFTSPHNMSPRVKFSNHLAYEKRLYYALKRFIKEACRFTQFASQPNSNPTKSARDEKRNFLYGKKTPHFPDLIFAYSQYIKQPFSVENDCKYILCATKGVFDSLVSS